MFVEAIVLGKGQTIRKLMGGRGRAKYKKNIRARAI